MSVSVVSPATIATSQCILSLIAIGRRRVRSDAGDVLTIGFRNSKIRFNKLRNADRSKRGSALR